MDAASFNFAYVDILVEEFPAARFIFTIRDCYSWLESALNMTLEIAPRMPAWMIDYTQRARLAPFTPEVARSRETFVHHVPEMVDAALTLWSTGNRSVLEALPPDRSLILRTGEISHSLDRIATFLGIPEDTLVPEHSHRFRARQRFAILQDVDYDFLCQKVDHYCADIMRDFFPGYSLRDFLAGRSWQAP